MGLPGKRRRSFSLLVVTFIGTVDSSALVLVIALHAVFLGAGLGGSFKKRI